MKNQVFFVTVLEVDKNFPLKIELFSTIKTKEYSINDFVTRQCSIYEYFSAPRATACTKKKRKKKHCATASTEVREELYRRLVSRPWM